MHSEKNLPALYVYSYSLPRLSLAFALPPLAIQDFACIRTLGIFRPIPAGADLQWRASEPLLAVCAVSSCCRRLWRGRLSVCSGLSGKWQKSRAALNKVEVACSCLLMLKPFMVNYFIFLRRCTRRIILKLTAA